MQVKGATIGGTKITGAKFKKTIEENEAIANSKTTKTGYEEAQEEKFAQKKAENDTTTPTTTTETEPETPEFPLTTPGNGITPPTYLSPTESEKIPAPYVYESMEAWMNDAKKQGKDPSSYGGYLSMGSSSGNTTPSTATPATPTSTSTTVIPETSTSTPTVEQPTTPAVTPSTEEETPTWTMPDFSAGAKSYSEWLTTSGNDTQASYEEAIKAARQQYAVARATYGARAEQLGRAGLSASGYGDYLDGKAYAAMVGAMSQAETDRAEGNRQNALAYEKYLEAETDEAYQGYVNAYNAMISSGSTDEERLKMLAKLAYPDMTDEQLSSLLPMVTSINEENAEANRETSNQTTFNTMLDYINSGGTAKDESSLTNMIKFYDSTISDEDATDIAGMLMNEITATTTKTEQQQTQEQEQILGETGAAVAAAVDAGTYTNANQFLVDAEASGMSEEQKQAGCQVVYNKNAQSYTDRIMAASSLSDDNLLTPDEINEAVKRSEIDKDGAAELIKEVQRRTGDLLSAAFDAFKSGNDATMCALMGIDEESWNKMEDGEKITELYHATIDNYKAGAINTGQMSKMVSGMITNTLLNKDTTVSDIAGMAILLEDTMKGSGDRWLEGNYEAYVKTLANALEVEYKSKGYVDISCKGNTMHFGYTTTWANLLGDGENLGREGTKGELYAKDGVLYICHKNILSKTKWIKVRDFYHRDSLGKMMSKEQQRAVLDLLLLKYSK